MTPQVWLECSGRCRPGGVQIRVFPDWAFHCPNLSFVLLEFPFAGIFAMTWPSPTSQQGILERSGTQPEIPEHRLGREKPINTKKFGGTPPLEASGPQPTRGRVPFVPWKYPVCTTDVLSNLCGITHKSGRDVPDVPRFAPKPSLRARASSRHTDHQIPLCDLCLPFFLLPIKKKSPLLGPPCCLLSTHQSFRGFTDSGGDRRIVVLLGPGSRISSCSIQRMLLAVYLEHFLTHWDISRTWSSLRRACSSQQCTNLGITPPPCKTIGSRKSSLLK